MTLSDYIWRRARWIRVRRHMTLAATLIEPATESVLLGLIAGWGFYSLFGFPIWAFFPLHIISWLSLDLGVYSALAGHPLPATKRWSFISAWACRELLALPIWTVAIFGSEVEWRNVRYRIVRNGEAARADRPGKQATVARWVTSCWKGSSTPNGYQAIDDAQ